MENLMKLVILLSLCGVICATSKPVLVRDSTNGQLVTSSLLTWETFNNDPTQLRHAVVAGNFNGEDTSKAYVCRATINSIPVSGYTKKRMAAVGETHVCIISQHSQFRTKQKGEFDVLLNRGNGAKLQWVKWEKLIPFSGINGAVSTINGASRTELYFVARYKKDHSMEHHEIDHAVGWFDPSDGLGKIYATIASEERSFESGELLVATEAIRYELFDVTFLSQKLRENVNRTLLGQALLKNEGDETMDVNTVIGYEYDVVRNFGNHEGIARFVNTTAYVKLQEPIQFLWGIQIGNHAVSSKAVSTKLAPGTALNVTLWGKYITKEGPYKAKLVIYWADGTKSKKQDVVISSGLEQTLEDELEIEHSPTYWLHNNTVVPTTTQRTTISTSTQGVHKSIFSTSMKSNEIERITERMALDPSVEEEPPQDPNAASMRSAVTLTSLAILVMLKLMF